MALVRYGSIVTELRGKMSGSCFSKCQSGFIMSNLPLPRVNTSTYNALSKRAVVNLVSTWHSLSAAQKLAWTAQAALTTFYNALNEPYNPTGYQLFFAVNNRIARFGGALIQNAVTYQVQTLNVAQPTSIVFNTNTFNFGFNPTAVANSFYALYTYKAQNKAYQGSNPPWRLLKVAASFDQVDLTLVPLLKSMYPSIFKVGAYVPILQLQQNYSTGVISRLGLPSLIIVS